jgi:hypothetical protein
VGQHFRSFRPEPVEEGRHGVLAAAFGDPGDLSRFVVGDDGEELARPLAPGFLVDPDHRQAVEAVRQGGGVRGHPRHDAGERLPGDPELSRCFRPRHLRSEPCGVLFERDTEIVVVACPRDRRRDLPVLQALDPRQPRLQEALLAVYVQGPPAAHIEFDRNAPGSAPGAAVPRLVVGFDHDDQHLFRRFVLPRPPFDVGPQHLNVPGIEYLVPDRAV